VIENLEVLEPAVMHHHVHEIADAGYRYVTMTSCSNEDGSFDLFYSFDKDYKLITLKTTVGHDEPVASISNIYLAAAFAENEISELFGVNITGKAIDYGGHFILADGAPESPFGKGVILIDKNKEGAGNDK
jgi:ech hydrogenase subunit D